MRPWMPKALAIGTVKDTYIMGCRTRDICFFNLHHRPIGNIDSGPLHTLCSLSP